MAIGGGFFVVPSFAAVQSCTHADKRARVIAVNNMISAAFVAGSSVLVAILQGVGVGNAWLFAMLGVGNLVATGQVLRIWSREGVRDFAGLLFKLLFRVEVRGQPKPAPLAMRFRRTHARSAWQNSPFRL